jgi:uncharacterized membrane protein YgcG
MGVARVPAGDAFNQRQTEDITGAIQFARQESDLDVSVYVGTLTGDSRAGANRLHAALGQRGEHAVLVAVDPAARALEIVVGSGLRYRLDDRASALAALAMTTSFSAGDLSGGIVNGVRQLAEHARAPRVLHSDS